jgi:hypothetical protein
VTPHHHRERLARGHIHSEHLVQLFDGVDTLSDYLATHLYDGWRRTDALLVVARPNHWAFTLPKLEALGCPTADVIASGQLVVLDAATTLAGFMVNGQPDRGQFDAQVAQLVARLSDRSAAGLTIYGEMVDILAEQGDLHAAEELEALWNKLGEKCSFRLLCGYASAHFADARMASHLRVISDLHTHAYAAESDLLGKWLLADRHPRYHTEG